jgi:glycosyltransferase involved in cell wall biosynthesis
VSDPTISVVMPAYNGATMIEETLATLGAQTFGDFEVLVVDDVSTDNTREVVAAWPDSRVRLLCNEVNSGPVVTRNRAVGEARGRYIAALDHDDLCLPDRFARQVAFLDAHPDVALLATAADFLCEGVIGPSGYAPVSTPALLAWLTLIENPIVWSTVMIRAEAAHALHPFTRPDILYAEDFDLYHRIQPLGRIARIDEPLLHYRQHPGGVSKRFVEKMRISAIEVLADAHRPQFGPRAAEIARLIVHHNMGGEPVPDRETLQTLGEAIGAIQARFLDSHGVGAEDRKLIRWETAQRWGRIGRAGLRSGTLTIADILAVRPEHLGLGYAGLDALLWSGAIGGARRARTARR